ncbi:HNH endonuclease, partial [Halobacterium salinarum]|uniref:HNH endonuclease n=1 Tax=Halobacterium salinarum TaxID=2242 RepID=UPI0025554E26
MVSKSLVEAVFERWGKACVVCGRRPEEWLETDFGTRTQANLSFHHVNGDDTDDRVENLIPLCQSCHVHIHRVDEPPYRLWHRQLPLEHRHAWNQHYHEYYEGPRLTR